jgi:coatomer subunit beta'
MSNFLAQRFLTLSRIKTAQWIGDCLIYINAANRLNYFIGTEPYSVTNFDRYALLVLRRSALTSMYFRSMSLLGYIPVQSRVYVMDKDMNVSGYSLALSMIEYQTAVLRGDMSTAEQILPTVPKEQRNKVARFLEGKGMQRAMVSTTT